MTKHFDNEVISQLQQSIDELTVALNTMWVEYNDTVITVKTMRYYVEVMLQLLIKEDLVDENEFTVGIKSAISDGESKRIDNDAFVKYMETIINKVNTTTFNGNSGFMTKPDLGNV